MKYNRFGGVFGVPEPEKCGKLQKLRFQWKFSHFCENHLISIERAHFSDFATFLLRSALSGPGAPTLCKPNGIQQVLEVILGADPPKTTILNKRGQMCANGVILPHSHTFALISSLFCLKWYFWGPGAQRLVEPMLFQVFWECHWGKKRKNPIRTTF